MEVCRDSGSQPAHMLLLPALNAMFDITTTRTEAMKNHPPSIIFAMIGVLSLAASLLAGYGMAGGKLRSWVHIVGSQPSWPLRICHSGHRIPTVRIDQGG